MKARAVVMLAGAAVALAAGGAGESRAAVAGLQDDRIVVDPVDTIPARIDLMARSGARVVRVDLFWSDVAATRPADPRDPADPAYRFSRWDRIFSGLVARGIRPLVSVYSAPAWATGGRRAADRHTNNWAPRPGDYAAFMEAVARRYSGGFTDPATGARLPQVRHLEVWNEPNLAGFLRPQAGGAGVRRYIALARAAYPAVKRGNPRAIVIVGAVGPRSTTDHNGTAALSFMRALLRARVRMDAYSQHVYPAAGPRQATRAIPAWGTLPVLLDTLEAARPRTPFFITEAGYTTASTPFRTVRVTPARQASFLRQIYALPVVRRRVALVVWYQAQDNRFWPGGLIYADGRPKPAWRAFTALSGRRSLPLSLRP